MPNSLFVFCTSTTNEFNIILNFWIFIEFIEYDQYQITAMGRDACSIKKYRAVTEDELIENN